MAFYCSISYADDFAHFDPASFFMVLYLRWADSGPGRKCYYEMRDADVSELADDDHPDDDENRHQTFVHLYRPAVIDVPTGELRML